MDGRGRVRSPTRYRVLSAVSHVGAAALAVAATAMYVDIFGPLGGLVGLLFGGALAIGIHRRQEGLRAAALVQDNRLDEAEAICRRTLARRWASRHLKALAHQNLAAIATRRGRLDTALDHLRQALRLRHSSWRRRNVLQDILGYAEINLLASLGRAEEARVRLDSRGAAPEGDYLRLQHWTAELHVQFLEGRMTIDDEDLWGRSQAALRISGAAALLALCSWATSRQGDEEMSRHLLEQALERAEGHLPLAFPQLWIWVRDRQRALRLDDPATE